MDLVTLALAKRYADKKFAEVVTNNGYIVVDVLPTSDISSSAIYILRSIDAQGKISYLQYGYIDGAWQVLGISAELNDLQEEVDYITTTLKDMEDASTWGTF